MCGIAGYYSVKGHFGQQELKSMSDCLAHRGPDADGFFTDVVVGLAHRRLSIIDLSVAANQPMFSHDGRYCIIFNGEIYNFREIAAGLKEPLRTHSDTEVILQLIAAEGPEVVSKFNGMFAIAFYDTVKKELLLFRDRMGVKPVYYYYKDGDFVFASELKAFLQLKGISSGLKVNHTAIAQFLHFGYIAEPNTIYENVFKFPSGSYARISASGVEVKRYWKTEEQVKPGVITDFSKAKAEFNNLIRSSVELRMISDVPFGTFLSGGVDSSLITAVAQSLSADPIKTFSIGFNESSFNESKYAKKVSQHLHTEHYEFIVTYQDAIDLIEKMMDTFDEPFADPSAIPTMIVSRLARQYVTMTLSGDGGDELFMGYGMYNWAERLDKPMIQAFRKPISLMLSTLSSRHKRAAHMFDYTSLKNIRSHIFSQEQYFFSEKEISEMMVKKLNGDYIPNSQYLSLSRKLSAKEEQALFDLNYYLKDDLLVKVDRASMYYSLEARTPFLDYRVVSFALNLSEQLKVKEGINKYLLKEVLYDYVPKDFFDRPKWGFTIPLREWMLKELKFLVDKYLSSEVIDKHGIVRNDMVQNWKRRFFKGDNYLYNRLWNLIVLHRWLEKNSN